MIYEVSVSEDALEAMAIAAIESYHLGNGRVRESEIYGFVYGFQTEEDDEIKLYIDKMYVSLSAKGNNISVTPNPGAQHLINSIVTKRSPHRCLVGDFHTHPYTNRTEVDRDQGFEFSPQDFKSFLNSDFLWEESNDYPMMLTMTICRLQRVFKSKDNISALTFGNLTMENFGFG